MEKLTRTTGFKIELRPDGRSTELVWTRRWLSLTPAGEEWLRRQSESAYEERMRGLRDALRGFLAGSGPGAG